MCIYSFSDKPTVCTHSLTLASSSVWHAQVKLIPEHSGLGLHYKPSGWCLTRCGGVPWNLTQMSGAAQGWRLCCQRRGNESSSVGFSQRRGHNEEWEEMRRKFNCTGWGLALWGDWYTVQHVCLLGCVSLCLRACFPLIHARTPLCCPVLAGEVAHKVHSV